RAPCSGQAPPRITNLKLLLVPDAVTCQRGAHPLHGLTMLIRKPLIRAGTRLLKSRSVAICRAIARAVLHVTRVVRSWTTLLLYTTSPCTCLTLNPAQVVPAMRGVAATVAGT